MTGKDSFEHRAAGAHEVLVSSANRFALMRELRAAPELRLKDLLALLAPVDLALIEGYKFERHVKIEVHRASVGKPLLFDGDENIRAVISETPVATALPRRADEISNGSRPWSSRSRCRSMRRWRASDGAAQQGCVRVRRRAADGRGRAGGDRRARPARGRVRGGQALEGADGRVLARTLRAPLDLPPFDNSAVDGYAVAFADLSADGTTTLPVAGRLTAGHGAGHVAAEGSAVRIFTGAPMPAGTDTVFMQEDVELRDGCVVLPAGLERGDNRRPRGEDIGAGSVALAAGRRLRPHDIALAAALGCERLTVRRPLKVAIFSTGDEIVSPGVAVAPGEPLRRESLRARGAVAPLRLRRDRSRHRARHA